ncbi:MAG: hypothetical protein AAF586_04140 [Planctomycetota bacterium]
MIKMPDSGDNTERSLLKHPYAWLLWLVAILFFTLGTAALVPTLPDVIRTTRSLGLIEAARADEKTFVIAGIAAGFAAIGGLAFVLVSAQKLRARPFAHAPLDTLPDMPTQPLIHNRGVFRGLRHRLRQTDDGFVIEPRPGTVRRDVIGITAFALAFIALIGWLCFGPLADSLPLPPAASFAVATLCCSAATGMIVLVLLYASRSELYSTRFNGRERVWRIELPERSVHGSMNGLVAIQLCPHYQVSGGPNRTHHWAFQVNLVSGAAPYDRHLLFEAETPLHAIPRLASEIALAIDLPLVHHATPAHIARIKSDMKQERSKA